LAVAWQRWDKDLNLKKTDFAISQSFIQENRFNKLDFSSLQGRFSIFKGVFGKLHF
jgi:hypothetical protein